MILMHSRGEVMGNAASARPFDMPGVGCRVFLGWVLQFSVAAGVHGGDSSSSSSSGTSGVLSIHASNVRVRLDYHADGKVGSKGMNHRRRQLWCKIPCCDTTSSKRIPPAVSSGMDRYGSVWIDLYCRYGDSDSEKLPASRLYKRAIVLTAVE